MSIEARNDPRKYIIGWLVCRPGKRAALMELVVPYVSECRREEGCVFFEMNPSVHEPDPRHAGGVLRGPGGWNRLPELCVEGRFENVFPRRASPDRTDFVGAR